MGGFVTEDARTSTFNLDEGTACRVECRTWLAPFDLGVSQWAVLDILPTEMSGVYEVKLSLTRETGDSSNWKRASTGFLNTLRKQFLIWRTLKKEDRERYLIYEPDGAE